MLSVGTAIGLTGRILQPLFSEINTSCSAEAQTQFANGITEPDVGFFCEEGSTIMILAGQGLILFLGLIAFAVYSLRLIRVSEAAVITIVFLVYTTVLEYRLPDPNTYLTLPLEGLEMTIKYYAFVLKELVFGLVASLMYLQGQLAGARRSARRRMALEEAPRSSEVSDKELVLNSEDDSEESTDSNEGSEPDEIADVGDESTDEATDLEEVDTGAETEDLEPEVSADDTDLKS